MKKIVLVMMIAACNTVLAQDIFQEKFYMPELVMKYREEAGLSATQVEMIEQIYNSELPLYNRKKWDLDADMTRLEKLISESNVDAKAATAQLEKVLALETEIKKMKLDMLVKVKNALTPVQQTKLDTYKSEIVSYTSISASLNEKQNVTLRLPRRKDLQKALFHIINGTEEKMVTEFPTNIDPADVESLQILRGDGATAMYGKPGENGVIVVVLKKKK